jgi:hypothetical protein
MGCVYDDAGHTDCESCDAEQKCYPRGESAVTTNYPHNFQPMATKPDDLLHLQGQLYCTKCGTTISMSSLGCRDSGCPFPTDARLAESDAKPESLQRQQEIQARLEGRREALDAHATEYKRALQALDELQQRNKCMRAAFQAVATLSVHYERPCGSCKHDAKAPEMPPCDDCHEGDCFEPASTTPAASADNRRVIDGSTLPPGRGIPER